MTFVTPFALAATIAAALACSSLAHAETNVLARLKYRQYSNLVLTTTLEPCLQCAAAIRLGPIGTVRFAGADIYWEGSHDFGKLSQREATRAQPIRIGPIIPVSGHSSRKSSCARLT